MGKGDKRSKRGKIKSGTYGSSRLKSANKKKVDVTKKAESKPVAKAESKPAAKKKTTKKAAAKKK